MNGTLRVLNLVFLALYILSAAVQYNDPDPIRWMAIYLGAAAACIAARRPHAPRWFPAFVGVAALLWTITLLPRVFGHVGFTQMFREVGMSTMEIEEGREAIGLLLVVLWMFVLTFAGRRIARSTAPGQADL